MTPRPAPRVDREPVAAEPDAELLRAISQGDMGRLGVLFDRHATAVRRFLRRMQAPPGELDDLVQASFLEVVKASRRYDGRLSARAWLLGVAAIVLRRRQHAIGVLVQRLSAWAREPRVLTASPPSELLEQQELELRAAAALARLPAKKREVFVMVVLEGTRGEDAASALGIPVATVWTRLHHARLALRRALLEGEL